MRNIFKKALLTTLTILLIFIGIKLAIFLIPILFKLAVIILRIISLLSLIGIVLLIKKIVDKCNRSKKRS